MSQTAPSRLLADLPAIYAEDPFLGGFLNGFEKLLIGIDDGVTFPDPGVAAPSLGLEQIIDGLSSYFDPNKTPEDFLPWLAGWVGLALRADLSTAQKRSFLSGVVKRYRRRGTPGNMIELISIFTVGRPEIDESGPANHFKVRVYLPPPGAFGGKIEDYPPFIDRQTAIAHAIIEAEKPAHTTYDLEPVFPSLEIGVHSTIGVDTLLGSAIYQEPK